MSDALSNSLRNLILKNKRLLLPGIGEFRLIRYAANRSENQATLLPPSYKIQFKNLSEISDQDWEKQFQPNQIQEVTSYAQEILSKLFDSGVAQVKGIGILSKSNGHFDFYQDSITANWYTAGLPEVALTPARKTWVTIRSYIPDLLKIQKNHFVWDLIPAIAISLLMFASFHNFKTHQTPPKNGISGTLPVDTILTDSTDLDYPKSDTPSVVIVDSVPIESVDSSDPKGVPPSSKRTCIIITGSFKTDYYRDRMMENLRKRGYKVYTETTDSMTRVGLEFECSDIELETYLRDIQKILAEDAWYLKPIF